MTKPILLFLLSFWLFIASATEESNITATEFIYQKEKITFEKDIKPIMNTYCGGLFCHHGKPSSFTKYTVIKHYVTNGELEKKVLIDKTMPKRKKLPEKEYNLLKKWLEQGALEN